MSGNSCCTVSHRKQKVIGVILGKVKWNILIQQQEISNIYEETISKQTEYYNSRLFLGLWLCFEYNPSTIKYVLKLQAKL